MTVSYTFRRTRLLAGCVVAAGLLVLAAAPTSAASLPSTSLPRTYVVSNEVGATPEGIAVTRDGTIYVTSVATGAVYRGDVHNPNLRLFLPAGSDGRTSAAGIHPDRYGRLFIAGYSTGTLYVYSPGGRLLATRKAPHPVPPNPVPPNQPALLNDLAFTADAVYVTDSATGTLWRAALTGTAIGPLTAWVPPAGFPAPPVFLNGIVTSGDGRFALVADQGTDQLLRVDLVARTATLVHTTGGTMGADGLLLEGDQLESDQLEGDRLAGNRLEGNRLYGVNNFLAPDGSIRFVVRLALLDAAWRTATVVATSQEVGVSQSPTTIARDHGRLLWVNSQLFASPQLPPYTVTQVPGLT
jgi:sugar lactone lactonase YvrE